MAHCKVCGEGFEPKHKLHIYCKETCREKAYRDRPKNKKKIRESIKRWEQKNRKHYLAVKKAYRDKNRDRLNKKRSEYGKKCRLEAIAYYGGKCACCGEIIEEFLTIDHIKGGGTQHRKKVGNGWAFHAWLKRNDYPKGYRVLCWNCNCSRGAYGYCPHKKKKEDLR